MSAHAPQRSRVIIRIPASVRETLEAAAELQGSTLSQFLVQAAFLKAREILERQSVIRLNRERTRRVFELVDRAPPLSVALRDAKATHRKLVRSAD